MSKIVLNDITNSNKLSLINENFDKIENEFNQRVLYRDNPSDVEPNQLESDMDVNGMRIYNLPVPLEDHEAARLKDVRDSIAGIVSANLIPFVPAGNISATNVQAAVQELDTEKASSVDLNAHIGDVTSAHIASSIGFTPAGSIAAVNVQTAVEEVATEAQAALTVHTGAVSGAHAATAISFSPVSTIAATDVQSAIAEVNAEKRELPVVVVETYSASITMSSTAGEIHSITATNGTAFTINAPTGPVTGRSLLVTIRNASGGALGAVTWNAVFKLAAWTSPANGFNRTIAFYYDGTNWIEMNRITTDVPN